jgi:hypothetical protein
MNRGGDDESAETVPDEDERFSREARLAFGRRCELAEMFGQLPFTQHAAARAVRVTVSELIVRAYRYALGIEAARKKFVTTRVFAETVYHERH